MTDKASILFIDDEERILRSLKMLFRGKFDVFVTTEPEEAFQLVKDNNVHVIVSDQRMPKMFGAQVLARVKELSPQTMRILLTGYSDMEAAIEAVNQGEIFRHISKPWKPEELIGTVTEAAEIAREFQQAAAEPSGELAPAPPELLVIDDDPSTASLVKAVAGEGATVYQTASLEEAFDLLAQSNIGVVVTELRVGGQDISQAIHALKRYKPDVQTVALTSFTDTSALIDLINHGQVYRFLPKPANKALLERSLNATLTHYRALAARPQLLKRHKVKVDKESETKGLSGNILGFLDKLRAQAQARLNR